MTHPIYSETYLTSLPLPRLKEIAKQLGTKPVVDARFKKTWVLVILRKQARTVALIEAVVELTAIDPQSIERIEPTDEPIEAHVEQLVEPTDQPIEAHTENLSATPIEVPRQSVPMLIAILVIALVLLMSIAIVPVLVLVSIVITLGQPQRGITPTPKPIGSTT